MRFDIDAIKRATSLLNMAQQDTILKRVASTQGGEYAGPCPFCGGRDRFHVQPDHEQGGRWLCRGCTNGKWQDAIAYVMRRKSIGFVEACSSLAGSKLSSVDFATFNPTRRYMTKASDLGRPRRSHPSEQWQTRARKFVHESEHLLWANAGEKARNWLFARGLREDTLRQWHIGFNPVQVYEPLSYWGLPETDHEMKYRVWLPVGITIPCEIDGIIWYVKIRRAQNNPKYIGIKGGMQALFGAHTLPAREVAVLCEGEFDCILLNQEIGDLAGTATLGSASKTTIDLKTWGKYLLPVSRFLIGYDMDSTGEKGAVGLSAVSARMVRIAVPKLRPNDKDATDFWKAGGNLRDWLTFEMARLDHASAHARMEGSLQDPRIVHQKILDQIVASVQSHERASGRTWAEILREVETVTPGLVQRYHASHNVADCDIYGRWKSGIMAQGDLDGFIIALNAWQQATLELLKCHSEKCAS